MLKMFDTVDREELLKFLGTAERDELLKFLGTLDDTLDTLKEMKKEGLTEDLDGLPRGFYSGEAPFEPQDEPFNPEGGIDFSDFAEVLDKIMTEAKNRNEAEDEDEDEDFAEADESPLFNVSTTVDEKLVYIQLPLAGWSENEVSVHLNEDHNHKFVQIVGVSAQIENSEEIYLKQDFTKKDFDTKIVISDEAFNGDVNVSLEHGLLTVVFEVAQPILKAKKVF